MRELEIDDAARFLISQGRMPAVPRDDCYWHDCGGVWALKTPGDIPLPQGAMDRMLAAPLKRLCDERGITFRGSQLTDMMLADQRSEATLLLSTSKAAGVTAFAMVEALRYFHRLDEAQAMRVIAEEVLEELGDATQRFGAFNSAHEGFAIAKEEMDELWAEAIQVAAMMIRFIHDSCRET